MQRTSSNAWNVEEFKNFLEGFPLYVKFRTALPLGFHGMIPKTLRIHCPICGVQGRSVTMVLQSNLKY
jgi:hypothetical protein